MNFLIIWYPYSEIDQLHLLPDEFALVDHCTGFDASLNCNLLKKINDYAVLTQSRYRIHCHVHYPKIIKEKYSNLDLVFDFDLFLDGPHRCFQNYNIHPTVEHENFVCSFNGSDHISRKLLVAALQRWRYFDPDVCSKNFQFTVDKLDGHLAEYLDPVRHRFYRPFFIGADSEIFFDEIHSFGYVPNNHASNIHNLERQLTSSFLHVVSETMATSYYPFVTEKFLYSVVTRGLFLAYAQPGWHDHVERQWGFKKYQKIFDYRFDAIQNPVERLAELMSMISKFSVLGTDDWRDLYEMEIDTIEYNYDHYFNKRYLDCLKQC